MNRSPATPASAPRIPVLFEDNHLLVIDKPAGLATMGGLEGESSVHQWATEYLRRRYNKPGNVFVGIVSRLDKMTTGVLVLARTSKSAARLSIQFGGPGKSKKVSSRAEKVYLALVEGDPVKDSGLSRSGRLEDHVYHDDHGQRMRVAKQAQEHTSLARQEYKVLQNLGSATLLAVRLQTGRKHQIRLQWAERGHPVLGDQKYGSKRRFAGGVALHSWRLLITHPTTSEPLRFAAVPPSTWNRTRGEILTEAWLNECIGDWQKSS
ncbi:MAG: RluA family pseudouridine synthase [Planctomycetota bacterium]